ncbi:MAG: hypothetical protein QM760_17810 [Nibricoccus sp.]
MNIPTDYWRYAIAVIVALVGFKVALWIISRASKPPSPIASFSLDQTISDIKAELAKLEAEPGAPLGLRLTEIEIALQLSQTEEKTSSAGLSVPVFNETEITGNASWSWEEGSKVTIVLAPPADSIVLSAGSKPALKFADLLISVRESLRKAMQNEPRLAAKSIELELAFVLVAETSAEANVKVQLVSLGVGRTQKSTTGNTITLTYENPAFADKASAKPTPP